MAATALMTMLCLAGGRVLCSIPGGSGQGVQDSLDSLLPHLLTGSNQEVIRNAERQ